MSIPITNVRNAVSMNAENTSFNVEIEHPEYGWIPYTLNPYDTDNTIDNTALRALIGNNYRIRTQEEIDTEASLLVRMQRDDRLANEVDPIVTNPLRWGGMTTEQQNAWAQYRTGLLNITDQSGFPHNVVWPTPPTEA